MSPKCLHTSRGIYKRGLYHSGSALVLILQERRRARSSPTRSSPQHKEEKQSAGTLWRFDKVDGGNEVANLVVGTRANRKVKPINRLLSPSAIRLIPARSPRIPALHFSTALRRPLLKKVSRTARSSWITNYDSAQTTRFWIGANKEVEAVPG